MNAIVKKFKNGNTVTTIEQAKAIQKSLGTFTAARYLLKRGWSLEGSLFILAGV